MPVEHKPRVCPLCEAGCGLLVSVEGGKPIAVTGDPDDVTSRGFVCPKGLELLNLESDPDRLRQPVQRLENGEFVPISWEAAFDRIAVNLKRIQKTHGRDAVAVHVGTVGVHKYAVTLMYNALKGALRTRNWTGVVSQDTGARFAAAHLMYGSAFSIAVPDIDRTDYLLCLGANPWVSNGSMMVAPNVRNRIRGILERGGKVVVVDPRRTETARAASEHIPIVPGTDAAFLLAMVQHLVEQGRVDERQLARKTRGWSEAKAQLLAFSPQRVADFVGVPSDTIERLALQFADAPSSVAYSRMGPGNARFSTLSCYAVELLNLVAGRLGKVGGAMFPTPAIDLSKLARLTGQDTFNSYQSRVRGLPEVVGELPATTLAEEMETEGQGQIRALVTYASNPVLAAPNGQRLDRALAKLDFMVSVDIYINETSRHADVILPPTSLLSEDHADVFFANMMVRNAMRWAEPVLPTPADERADWQILLELTQRLGGGLTAIRPVDAVLRWLGVRATPMTLADLALRVGPYGDRYWPWSKGLNAKRLRAKPHGVDLGPLVPGFKRRVFHRGRRVQLALPEMAREQALLLQAIDTPGATQWLLIGRRDLRSNNSWMHNLPGLMTGKPRCVLYVHPLDAEVLGVREGQVLAMTTELHSAEVPVHLTEELRRGVVSLPHGFGHARVARYQKVAGAHAGVSVNDWISDCDVENVAGQSILNGVSVDLKLPGNQI